MALSQAEYFAQNPDAGFGDYLNYAQGKTAGGQFQAPGSLPPGFLQSDYGPAYNSVLQSFNDPNYDKNSDPNGYAALLQNWTQAYAGGRPFSEWQQIAAQSAQGAIEPDIAQAALGGAAGVLYGAGVGAGAGAGAGSAAGGAGGGASGGLLDASAGAGAGVAGAAGGASPTLGQVGGLLSGGAAVTNALNGGGAPAGQGGIAGSNNGGIIGALLGGALGGMQGGNRPAGTTTTTTNQTLAPGGLQNLQDTIAGNYLNPASNPYLAQTYDAAARQITPRVNSLFEASGRYGSGAHQGVLGQSLADLGTSIYGGNYNAERSRQLTAAGTPIGNTVQNPYFTNPLGGALSGALAGGVLGGGTNFLGGANGGILNGAINGIGNIFGNYGSSSGYPEQLSGPGSGYTPPASGYPQELGFGGDSFPSPTSVDSYVRRTAY